jgi:hypothetical protein
MALGIVPGDPDSVTNAFADLNIELDKEKAARKAARIEVDMLARAVKDLKISADKFATQIPTLEDMVKHLKDKVVDGLNEVRAQELCLERTSRVNEDYKKQNAQLSKKLESKSFGLIRIVYHSWTIFWLTPLWLAESNAELNALKAMVDHVVAFFYLGESSSKARTPQMLDSLPTRSQEIILAKMRQSVSLTLKILKSLYPRADLDVMGEGFTVTCSHEEALKLVKDSDVMAGQVLDMLGVDLSLG